MSWKLISAGSDLYWACGVRVASCTRNNINLHVHMCDLPWWVGLDKNTHCLAIKYKFNLAGIINFRKVVVKHSINPNKSILISKTRLCMFEIFYWWSDVATMSWVSNGPHRELIMSWVSNRVHTGNWLCHGLVTVPTGNWLWNSLKSIPGFFSSYTIKFPDSFSDGKYSKT